MSEESLPELICRIRRQSPGTAEHYSCVEMLDARIVRAEAAAVINCLHRYGVAKDVVRKLEEGK